MSQLANAARSDPIQLHPVRRTPAAALAACPQYVQHTPCKKATQLFLLTEDVQEQGGAAPVGT